MNHRQIRNNKINPSIPNNKLPIRNSAQQHKHNFWNQFESQVDNIGERVRHHKNRVNKQNNGNIDITNDNNMNTMNINKNNSNQNNRLNPNKPIQPPKTEQSFYSSKKGL